MKLQQLFCNTHADTNATVDHVHILELNFADMIPRPLIGSFCGDYLIKKSDVSLTLVPTSN